MAFVTPPISHDRQRVTGWTLTEPTRAASASAPVSANPSVTAEAGDGPNVDDIQQLSERELSSPPFLSAEGLRAQEAAACFKDGARRILPDF